MAAINLDVALLQLLGIVIGSIVVAPIVWLVGKAFEGPEKAKFSDAFWIVFLGSVIGGLANLVFYSIFEGFTANIIGFIIQLIIWVGLVKHFFDTSGGRALLIAIIAAIVTIIIFAILAAVLVSIGMLAGWTWL